MLIPFILSTLAFAATPESALYKVSSSTSVGQGYLSEGVSVGGEHPVTETAEVDWSGAYTFSRVPVGGSSDTTNDVELTAGFRDNWDVGGGASFSRTPDENLKTAGPEAWLGYLFDLGEERTLEPKFSYKGQTYTQTFGGTTSFRPGTRRSVSRPATGSQSIRQNEFSLGVDVAAWSFLSFHVAGSMYKYSRDVSSFLANLDTPRAVATGASSFSTTLGGFPKNSVEAGMALFPWEAWTVLLDFTRTKVQADGSISTGSKIEVERELSKAFKLGLGFDHETSEQMGEENLTMLDLAFSF